MDVESQSEIKARLNIAGFECSPEEITSILGIHPTKTWLKGELVLFGAKNVHKENGWSVESPCNSINSTVDVQVESLLSVIAPHVEAFANLPTSAYVELSCIIYADYYNRPAIGFSTNVIRMLANLGANIDIDFYTINNPSEKAAIAAQ